MMRKSSEVSTGVGFESDLFSCKVFRFFQAVVNYEEFHSFHDCKESLNVKNDIKILLDKPP